MSKQRSLHPNAVLVDDFDEIVSGVLGVQSVFVIVTDSHFTKVEPTVDVELPPIRDRGKLASVFRFGYESKHITTPGPGDKIILWTKQQDKTEFDGFGPPKRTIVFTAFIPHTMMENTK